VPHILAIRENPAYLERAADYFASKWSIGRKIYAGSMTDSLTTSAPTPRWYILVKEAEIIGSFGLLDNGFMARKDLTPWLCALYVEESERGMRLDARLLAHGRREAEKLGFSRAYLCTEHSAIMKNTVGGVFRLRRRSYASPSLRRKHSLRARA
jgi:hypothetical protein